MEDSFNRAVTGSARPWSFTRSPDHFGHTILIVEDDRDIREMTATLLDLAGFACVSCASAEAGLAALRDQRIDLILTDYALPKHTGVWLLDRAHEEGLIDETTVLIVTAHPEPAGTSSYEVVQKPFDLDDLVERVKRQLQANRLRRRGGPARKVTGKADGNGRSECPDPIELILYVSAHSPRSAEAVTKFRKVLARFSSSKVKLTVCDLSTNPEEGAEDTVAFTSTVVRDAPGPRTFILGHITNPDLLMELLSDCELEGN
jgi:DNA-binding response OmpR family regulator